MFLLYDILFLIFAILYLPYVIIKKKWHDGFKMRFGYLSPNLEKQLAKRKNIWIHAVSVGEVVAVKRFVEELQEIHRDKQIVVSTVTRTGNELARKHFPEAVIIYAPLDFSASVRSFLNAINPVCYIAAETEIWPNMFYGLYRREIPIIQVNGRISDKSFPRYKALSFFVRHILSYVSCFCMQTESDASRIKKIGAKPERVKVTGNMKFDGLSVSEPHRYGQIFEKDYGPVLVAGSTHPGEEEIVLNVFERLKKQFGDLSLILAPRHVERAEDVKEILEKRSFAYTSFSQVIDQGLKGGDIILVDTIGHLGQLYSYATVVFVGKSLLGRGGQNIIEPAAFSKPIIVGPHTENFRATIDLFKREDALVEIKTEQDFVMVVQDLLDHPNRAVAIGTKGKDIIESQQGAVANTLKHVIIPS